MANKLIQAIFKPKRDVLYEAAMSASNAIRTLLTINRESFDDIDLDQALFHKVFHSDPNSPSIYFLDQSQYLIFYPPNSKPYNHSFSDKCKFIEVLSGVIYDANSEKKLFKGDRIKVHPKDDYVPYTLNEKCVLRVCVGDCNSLFDMVCN